jgi:ABC-type multidrug transport system fused ATPase/permease subunit
MVSTTTRVSMKRPSAEPASLRTMFGYVRPHWPALLAGGLLSVATSATGLALPLVVRVLISDLSHHQGISRLILAMCALMAADAVLGAFGRYVLSRTAESIVLGARKRLMSHLLRITVPALDRSEPGELMSRATADTVLLRDATASCIVGFVVSALTALATLAIMALIDPVLLGVSLIALGGAAVLTRLVVPRIGREVRKAQEFMGVMAAALERTLGALRTVKACGAEPGEAARVQAAAVKTWRANLRAAKWKALVSTVSELSVQAAFLAVLAVGGVQVASKAINIGTLVAFLLYVFYLTSPVQGLMAAVGQYQVGAAAVTRIHEAEQLPAEPLQLEVTVADPGGRIPAEGGPASVEFQDVRFRYRPELPEVHHGISFVVPPGGMTAFVGPSGAGKTTVFSLIERFYEPDSGRILVDGMDLQEWSLAHVRAAIGYVEQDAPVLSGTMRENLLFGAPGTTAEDLAEVLRITRLKDMVEQLPDGLETHVGHRGTRLSGGERQRVAIARAVLRRPRLLLLDEATSQLDAINEAALRETVADVASLITVLVVAHRLSTITVADRIIVMDAGCILATGTHTELVSANPLYAELAATQFLATSA